MSRKTLRTLLLSVALLWGLTATVAIVNAQDRLPLCHATGSNSNPFVLIDISDSGYNGHVMHGDLPANGGVCPGGGGTPTATPEPITMLLFGAGLAGVGYAKRRMGRKEA